MGKISDQQPKGCVQHIWEWPPLAAQYQHPITSDQVMQHLQLPLPHCCSCCCYVHCCSCYRHTAAAATAMLLQLLVFLL